MLRLLLLFLPLAGLFAQSASIDLPAPDIEKLLRQDEQRNATRFAAPITVNLAPASAPETYTLVDGEYHWEQTFSVPGTTGLAALVDRVFLRGRGCITVKNERGERTFRAGDISSEHRLHSGFFAGETLTVSYRGPLPDTIPFRIQRIDHVFRPEQVTKDFGDGNECQLNAACQDNGDWADVESGTARVHVIVEEGVGWCSGNLINNTGRDGRPLLLTGFHCMDGFTPLYDLWRFDFGYASATCENPVDEPTPDQSYLGAIELSGRQESDFLLLEITDTLFVAEDHYFAGWDRSDGDVDGRVIHFHHPQGDIRKYGLSTAGGMDILNTTITWNSDVVTPADHHFEMDYAEGDYQPGSSGSGYFDDQRRLRGQLNGGNFRCPRTSRALVGRLFMSWDQGDAPTNRLDHWLDPLGTGAVTLDGESLLTRRIISGHATHLGEPVADVALTFRFSQTDSVTVLTDENGYYRAERPDRAAFFTVRGSYDSLGQPENGVDIFDVIGLRRHIIGFDTLPPAGLLAGDVNNSGTVRASDVVGITRIILGTHGEQVRGNWLVYPTALPLTPIPRNPQLPLGVALNVRPNHELILDFTVRKNGDTNGDAEL